MSELVTATGAVVGAALLAKPTKTALSELFANLLNYAGATVEESLNKLFAEFQVGSMDFLEKSYSRCANVKTLLSGDQPLPLLSIYVHLSLKCNKQVILDDDLINEIDERRFLAVVGLAGSGKSMFMRYLTVSRFNSPRGKIPLFVELRHLNKLKEPSLIDFIRTSCGTGGNTVSAARFRQGLIAGGFLLILDGFDEVEQRIREGIGTQIRALYESFPAISVVLSSRPDERFSTWQNCHVMHVETLTKSGIIELIAKTDYDEEVKNRFILEVENTLYRTHKTFLEVPLLATMMLLTYRQNAEISSKIHLFYKQAFDTLFTKHDAHKEQFLRQKFSGLASDDFETCFAAFCAAAYLDERVNFDERQALEYAKRASEHCGIKFSPKDFIRDLKETVCLLQQDGTQLAYVHRSFQEYFTAYFISKYNEKNIRELVLTAASRYDDVINLLYSLNRDSVETHWVLPEIKNFIKKYKVSIEKRNFRRIATEYVSHVYFWADKEDGDVEAKKDSDLLTVRTQMMTYGRKAIGLTLDRILRLYGRRTTQRSPADSFIFPKKIKISSLKKNFGASSLLYRDRGELSKENLPIPSSSGAWVCDVSKVRQGWFRESSQEKFYSELSALVSETELEIVQRKNARSVVQLSKKFI